MKASIQITTDLQLAEVTVMITAPFVILELQNFAIIKTKTVTTLSMKVLTWIMMATQFVKEIVMITTTLFILALQKYAAME